MISEAAKKAQKKYDLKSTKMLSVKLNKNTDADILRHIEKIDNKQSYIKALVREDMKDEDDVEEPKEDYIRVINSFIQYVEEADESFECDESVHKFIEKLKAWRRLQDKGFKFGGWKRDKRYWGDYTIEAQDYTTCDDKDLDLLFGGEE